MFATISSGSLAFKICVFLANSAPLSVIFAIIASKAKFSAVSSFSSSSQRIKAPLLFAMSAIRAWLTGASFELESWSRFSEISCSSLVLSTAFMSFAIAPSTPARWFVGSRW